MDWVDASGLDAEVRERRRCSTGSDVVAYWRPYSAAAADAGDEPLAPLRDGFGGRPAADAAVRLTFAPTLEPVTDEASSRCEPAAAAAAAAASPPPQGAGR